MNTLEVGKYYKNVNGDTVGPILDDADGALHYFYSDYYFNADGTSLDGDDPDIIIPQETNTTTYIQLLEAIVGPEKCAAIKEIMAQ